MIEPRTMWLNKPVPLLGLHWLPSWWWNVPLNSVRLRTIKANLR